MKNQAALAEFRRPWTGKFYATYTIIGFGLAANYSSTFFIDKKVMILGIFPALGAVSMCYLTLAFLKNEVVVAITPDGYIEKTDQPFSWFSKSRLHRSAIDFAYMFVSKSRDGMHFTAKVAIKGQKKHRTLTPNLTEQDCVELLRFLRKKAKIAIAARKYNLWWQEHEWEETFPEQE